MKHLNKENLKEFIDNYPTNYTGDYRDSCYTDGIKDVLADLEATFLWEPTNLITNEGYLEEEGIIDKIIETDLAKYKDPEYVPF